MIFDDVQALRLIQATPKAPQWVQDARKQTERLQALINGTNFKDHLVKRIEKIESEKRKKARDNFSRSIKDLNERLLRTLDNVYSATGGTQDYELSDKEKEKLITILSKIRDGKSLEQWLNEIWIKNLYQTDPNGIILLEYLADEKVYPTYKSIFTIRNYKANGQKLEWIMFEPVKVEKNGDTKEYIRFIDAKKDRTFRKEGENYYLLKDKEYTFTHPFNEVPGLINSNLIEPGSKVRKSPIDSIIEAEEEYARDQSVLTLYKYTKLFPVYYRYDQLCPECNGTGKVDEKNCPLCDGDRFLNKRDITDEIVLPLPDDENQVSTIPEPMGFISPDLETPEYYRGELNNLEIQMYETLWGSHKSKIEGANAQKTATEIWLDTQPVMNRLNDYSKVASFMEKQLTEWIANWGLAKDKTKQIAIITYGTRFIIDPPEALLDRYVSNRKDGAPTVVLDRQLHEYITSKYKNDPELLRQEILKKELEPYVHYSIKEVYDIFGAREAQKKTLFVNWWEKLETKDMQLVREKLEQKRDEYFNSKLLNQNVES